MVYVIFIILSVLEVAAFIYLMNKSMARAGGGSGEVIEKLESELQVKQALVDRFQNALSGLVDLQQLKNIVGDLTQLQDTLKTERGRSTITAAEVETVETRLRELEEIERELEASGLETKEEIEILRKKHAELKGRNTTLSTQLAESSRLIDDVISKIEMGEQMLEQINLMKAELVQCEQRIDVILAQIEEGNEQYFILKKRYDALDIEYAQLYEKFSSSE